MSTPHQWFFQEQGQVRGPISAEKLKQLADAGRVKPDTLVRRSDSECLQGKQVNGLFPEPALEMVAPPVQPSPEPEAASESEYPTEVAFSTATKADGAEQVNPYEGASFHFSRSTSRASGQQKLEALVEPLRFVGFITVVALVVGELSCLYYLLEAVRGSITKWDSNDGIFEFMKVQSLLILMFGFALSSLLLSAFGLLVSAVGSAIQPFLRLVENLERLADSE